MSPRAQRAALALIVLVTAVEYGHRQLLALALVPIGVDLGASDTALGALLTGFGVSYALLAVTAGRLADRGSRRTILAAGVAGFSVMTALGAAAGSYLFLFLTRLGVGAGQSGVAPAGTALLADAFPPERRATVLGLVGMAAPLGIVLALLLGGQAIEAFGWRVTFAGAGALGVVVAVLFAALVEEPPRGFSEGRTHEVREPATVGAVLRHMGGLASFRHVAAATALSSLGAMSVAQWTPGFLYRVHGLSLAGAGVAFAAASLGGTLGALLGGAWADRRGRVDPRWYVWVPALGSFATAPLHVAAFLWPSASGAVAWLVPALFVGMFFGPASAAVVQSLAPLSMRAMAGALLVAILTLVGMGAGPLATGAASDALRARYGEASLGYALCGVGVVYLWSGVHYLLAARSLAGDLSRARSV